ncbi:hypothetical protein Ccrd_003626 [Cynara cardunculus var. scolymus]|uniref:Ribosomal protein L33 n=1 Tax=Cynara cardunculus var. scolymus TaxID=59895 RepID=A0A118JWI6_CYNCS|nr:hypothetical protein Ccrd_003626 [Cynara cardunculus var. scolymus]
MEDQRNNLGLGNKSRRRPEGLMEISDHRSDDNVAGAGTGFFYVKKSSTRRVQTKLEFRKYDPHASTKKQCHTKSTSRPLCAIAIDLLGLSEVVDDAR